MKALVRVFLTREW